MLIDHKKLYRAVKKLIKLQVAKRQEQLADKCQGIYYDGKVEKALVPKNPFKDGGRATEKEMQAECS